MRVILVKEIYQNAIFPPNILAVVLRETFNLIWIHQSLVQAQTANIRLLSFKVIAYYYDAVSYFYETEFEIWSGFVQAFSSTFEGFFPLFMGKTDKKVNCIIFT